MSNLEYIIHQLESISDGEPKAAQFVQKLCKAAAATIKYQQVLIDYQQEELK